MIVDALLIPLLRAQPQAYKLELAALPRPDDILAHVKALQYDPGYD
jgi:hypothetical protein